LYSPIVTEVRLNKVVDAIRQADPTFEPVETPQEEAKARTAALQQIQGEDGALLRPLKPEEERWILNELVMSKASFEYWATRYTLIKTKEASSTPLFPLFESQAIILDRIGKIEEKCVSGERLDGILVAILKARQLGASTLSEAMIAHRAFLYGNTTALIAADVPAQSAYLYNMLERIYDNLPWWMQPEQKYREKESQLYFDRTDSLILVESGKSVRGGATLGQERGQMGRGKTFPLAHLSEISTWENAAQIDDALMPAIPRHHRTLAVFESTARGRGNEWHDMWLVACKGIGRVVPIFIPWYGESKTYVSRAPEGWEPSDLAKAHAARALEVSAKWCGKTIRLDRNQLYWWETSRSEAKEKRKLHVFLAEYCADPSEAFQNTGQSVFPFEVLHEIRNRIKEPLAYVECQPKLFLEGHENEGLRERD
jgi:hypothetical protein